MKRFFLFFILITILASPVFAELQCSVKQDCSSSETCIFTMFRLDNSHAATCGNYGYDVCCSLEGETLSAPSTLAASCSGSYGENYDFVISLLSTTNSHASSLERDQGGYSTHICLGSTLSTIGCHAYNNGVEDGSCDYGICLATLYQDKDSHVADCVTDPYKISICCMATAPEDITNNPPNQPTITNPSIGDTIDREVLVEWSMPDPKDPDGDSVTYTLQYTNEYTQALYDTDWTYLISGIAESQLFYTWDTSGLEDGNDYGIRIKAVDENSASSTWHEIGSFTIFHDLDNDGIGDDVDECPEDHAGDYGINGCPDDDNDGIINQDDLCSNTVAGCEVDSNGCPQCDVSSCFDDPACECTACGECGSSIFGMTFDCLFEVCMGCAGDCYWETAWFDECLECTSETACETYDNQESCDADPCVVNYCYWDGSGCCEDFDDDQICDACFIDSDGDRYGLGCPRGNDCDDTDNEIHEGCSDQCSQDGDGDSFGLDCANGADCDDTNSELQISCENLCILDTDGDGYGLGCENGLDCDDVNPDLNVDCESCTIDNDGDGYGLGCVNGPDCDDLDRSIHERCDTGCTQDSDGDGFGQDCNLGRDCDDTNFNFDVDCGEEREVTQTCEVTPDDPDGDCIDNEYDSDNDGDGLSDWEDPDDDNDGIIDEVDDDDDGDGVSDWDDYDANNDQDDDDISNNLDDDIDGDGKKNWEDDDDDNDEITDDVDPDDDNDGIVDSEDKDTDNDLDNDGIENPYDDDMDGDQIDDAQDSDDDNDGIIDTEDDDIGNNGIPDDEEDRDNDGMPDQWEEDNGLNPDDPSDADDDNDNDDLTNKDEHDLGTDPDQPETDDTMTQIEICREQRGGTVDYCDEHDETYCWSKEKQDCCGDYSGETWDWITQQDLGEIIVEGSCVDSKWYIRTYGEVTYYPLFEEY